MLPAGNWLEDRVGWLVEQWLPGWQVSHAQIADLEDLSLQSRSWDLVIHRPLPAELDLPPAARADGRYALVPKTHCCAVIDTKGRFEDVRGYAAKKAFDLSNQSETRQLDFLGARIVPVLLILASKSRPEHLESVADQVGLRAFVLAQAIEEPGRVTWKAMTGKDGVPPLRRFRRCLEEAARSRGGRAICP